MTAVYFVLFFFFMGMPRTQPEADIKKESHNFALKRLLASLYQRKIGNEL